MKHVNYLLLLLGALGIGIFLLSQDAQRVTPLGPVSIDEPSFTGLSIIKYLGGKKAFYIESDKASISNKRIGFFEINALKTIKMEGVKMGFYQGQSLASSITSDSAVLDMFSKNIFFNSNVKVQTVEGKALRCEEAEFLQQGHALSAPGQFIFTDNKKSVEGYGFRGDIFLTKYQREAAR